MDAPIVEEIQIGGMLVGGQGGKGGVDMGMLVGGQGGKGGVDMGVLVGGQGGKGGVDMGVLMGGQGGKGGVDNGMLVGVEGVMGAVDMGLLMGGQGGKGDSALILLKLEQLFGYTRLLINEVKSLTSVVDDVCMKVDLYDKQYQKGRDMTNNVLSGGGWEYAGGMNGGSHPSLDNRFDLEKKLNVKMKDAEGERTTLKFGSVAVAAFAIQTTNPHLFATDGVFSGEKESFKFYYESKGIEKTEPEYWANKALGGRIAEMVKQDLGPKKKSVEYGSIIVELMEKITG